MVNGAIKRRVIKSGSLKLENEGEEEGTSLAESEMSGLGLLFLGLTT